MKAVSISLRTDLYLSTYRTLWQQDVSWQPERSDLSLGDEIKKNANNVNYYFCIVL